MHNELTPNVLASRYASDEMRVIWSAQEKIACERELWVAILEVQSDLGVETPRKAIAAYRARIRDIDFESIARREKELRHDLKARIEEFCEISGYECIHRGLTSRDITENVEQLQLKRALTLICRRADALLAQLATRIEEYADTILVARTHNMPAQITTLGKRLAMFGEELHRTLQRLDSVVSGMPMHGVAGAVGTATDLLQLFGGQKEKVGALNRLVSEKLWDGAPTVGAVGQIYPRSFDFSAISALAELAAAPANIARSVRLMAGGGLANERQQAGQVGSSAMPHKVNPRISERINGLRVVLHGYLTMASGLAGEQWNEGDVSCSVVRRIALPNACYAAEGILENCRFLLYSLQINTAGLRTEAEQHLAAVGSSALLMAAVREGMGREEAHALISAHAGDSQMLRRLAEDSAFPLDDAEIQQVVGDRTALIGMAREQTEQFLARIQDIRARADLNDHPPQIEN